MEEVFAKPTSYNLVEFLGEGLNSCVYRAKKEDPASGISFEVALKILKSEKLVSIWRNEFARLSAVRSHHCVGLLGWEYIYNKPALVLEYVDGVTLEELIKRGQFTNEMLSEIFIQAQVGLEDLRRAGLFHGDLNLHNIMITCDGFVKLVDFGVIYSEEQMTTTLQFASPAILAGQMPSFETDLYSLYAIANEVARRCRFETFPKVAIAAQSSASVRNRIALEVTDAKNFRRNLMGRTQSLLKIKRIEWSWPRIAKIGLFCSLALVSLLSRGDQSFSAYYPASYLEVRTHYWVHLKINGESSGYAPIKKALRSNSMYRLQWESGYGKGETSLTLNEGEHIVLNDEFFRSYNTGYRSRNN